jgi:hypothetical protein
MQSKVKLHIICMLKHEHSDKPDKGQCQIVSWLRQVKVGKLFDYNTRTREKITAT